MAFTVVASADSTLFRQAKADLISDMITKLESEAEVNATGKIYRDDDFWAMVLFIGRWGMHSQHIFNQFMTKSSQEQSGTARWNRQNNSRVGWSSGGNRKVTLPQRLLASMTLTQCFIEVAWCVPQFGVRIFGCCDATADCMPLTARQLRMGKGVLMRIDHATDPPCNTELVD